jgi:DNA polymerase-3 subunit beta
MTSLAIAAPPEVATVPTPALQRALADVSRIVPSRPPVPVLAGAVIDAGPDGLNLAAFDYETSIRVLVDDRPFPTMYGIADAKRLSDLLKHHDKAGSSSITVGETEWHLSQGSMDAAGKVLKAEDYPKLPVVKGAWVFQVEGKALLEAARRAHVAAGRDQTLPVLQAVHLDFDQDVLEIAATDRYRLSVERIPVSRNQRVRLLKDWAPAKVHSATLVQIAAILSGQDVRVQWDNEIVVFRTDTTTITTRVQDGQYPAYRRLMPSEFVTTATIDRDLFVKRLKYVAEGCERNTPVRLDMSEAGLTLKAGSGDEVTTKATLPIGRFIGEPGTIAFNPKFLQDGLAVLGKSVTIGMTATTKPAVFFTEGDEDYRYLLMPVRISG